MSLYSLLVSSLNKSLCLLNASKLWMCNAVFSYFLTGFPSISAENDSANLWWFANLSPNGILPIPSIFPVSVLIMVVGVKSSFSICPMICALSSGSPRLFLPLIMTACASAPNDSAEKVGKMWWVVGMGIVVVKILIVSPYLTYNFTLKFSS